MSENPWRAKWPRDQISAMLLEQFNSFWGLDRGEVRALTDAMPGLGLSHGLILTDANAEPIAADGMTIEVVSLAEWLVQT